MSHSINESDSNLLMTSQCLFMIMINKIIVVWLWQANYWGTIMTNYSGTTVISKLWLHNY